MRGGAARPETAALCVFDATFGYRVAYTFVDAEAVSGQKNSRPLPGPELVPVKSDGEVSPKMREALKAIVRTRVSLPPSRPRRSERFLRAEKWPSVGRKFEDERTSAAGQ